VQSLSNILLGLFAERSTADLTPWEKYLNRQKKNQMERRKKHKNVSETNETKSIRSSINMTVGFDDPFFEDHDDTKSTTLPNSQTKKRSKKTKSKLTEEEQRQQEELELLVTGGSNKKAHFSLKVCLWSYKHGHKDFRINL
jgi:2-succinyl-5-enolpyruvyl-6-hydroxy-3-cyclohexene-1-carboxylate synthase